VKPDNRFLDDMVDTASRTDAALVVENPETETWDAVCDVLVVGVGLAGACATLRTAEDQNLSVIAIDRGMGGGASKLSGGIIYMGGGTKAQQEAGIEDSPENMAAYLAFETGDMFSKEMVSRFARASTRFQPWLEKHGVRLGGPATAAKTSYPETESLYFSGNETTAAGRALAKPAQRGHRAKPSGGGEPTGLSGQYLLPPLLDSIKRQPNVRFLAQTRAHRMIVDSTGEIVGIEVLQIAGAFARWRHARFYELGTNMIISALRQAGRLHKAAVKLEQARSRPLRIRVHKGVVLSAGGFTYNRTMMAKTAPAYLASVPLGTIGDDGSGIKLGMSVGAKADKLERISAWKFLYPPASWTKSCSIGPDGNRLVCEELYGARTGEAMFEKGSGKGWLILDQTLQDAVVKEVAAMKKMFFQKVQFKAIINDYTASDATLEALAAKIGVPEAALADTVKRYNDSIDSGAPDALGKSEKLRQKIETGPFFSTSISADLKMSPTPALTMGGLVCDEVSGAVLDPDGRPVPKLFAAGRNAVGICSNYYVSGLSLADCVWSGWRAAESLKGNNGSAALA
jgi:3-oxo-5alpha-steroid 4-dehydrogenase